jgi:hypothetical protein
MKRLLMYHKLVRPILLILALLVLCAFVLIATTACHKMGGQMEMQIETCAQTTLIGRSEPMTYDNQQACVNDRTNLQNLAIRDGINQCNNFCTQSGAGCIPLPRPNPQRTTHPCRMDDSGQVVATAETAQFDCICKRP